MEEDDMMLSVAKQRSQVPKSDHWSQGVSSHTDRAGKEDSVRVEMHRDSTFSSWKEKCDTLKMAKSKNKAGENKKIESQALEPRGFKEEGQQWQRLHDNKGEVLSDCTEKLPLSQFQK